MNIFGKIASLLAVLTSIWFFQVGVSAAQAKPPVWQHCFLWNNLDSSITDLERQLDTEGCLGRGADVGTEATKQGPALWLYFNPEFMSHAADGEKFLSVNRFIFDSAILHVRYFDGQVISLPLSSDKMKPFLATMKMFRFPLLHNSSAIKDAYLGIEILSAPTYFKHVSIVDKSSDEMTNLFWVIAGLLIGIQLSMLLYNFVLATQFKFAFHFIYCGILLGIVILTFVELNADLVFGWDINPAIMFNLRTATLAGLCFLTAFFFNSFLEDDILPSFLDRLLKVLVLLIVFTVIWRLSIPGADNNFTVKISARLMAGFFVVMLIGVGIGLKRGSRASVFFALAWCPLILSIFVQLAWSEDYIVLSELTLNFMLPIASSAESIILSIGVVDRLKTIQKERDAATEQIRHKETLMSVIGHDVKNAIFGARRFGEFLINPIGVLSQEEISSHGKQVLLGLDSATEVLNNLQHWALLQKRPASKEEALVDFKDLAERCFSLFGYQASLKSIDLSLDIGEGDSALINEWHVDTIIRNLINNAIKFTCEGGSVSLQLLKSQGQFNIIVEDSGSGLQEAERVAVIEGQLSDNVDAQNFTSSGFGLYICKKLIDENHGSMTTHTNSLGGLRVEVKLPVQG